MPLDTQVGTEGSYHGSDTCGKVRGGRRRGEKTECGEYFCQ